MTPALFMKKTAKGLRMQSGITAFENRLFQKNGFNRCEKFIVTASRRPALIFEF